MTILKLIKTYVYHHFSDYMAGLISRHERVMDKACMELKVSLDKPSPAFIKDVFEAQFLWHFEGPKPSKLFIDGGKEGSYAFCSEHGLFQY